MIATNSEVGIANVALARLGADSIRDFNENNKRARMSKVLYDYCRDYLLGKYNWSFAKTTAILQQTTEEVIVSTNSQYSSTWVYAIPSDCIAPIEMLPAGKQNRWEIVGQTIHSNLSPLWASVDGVDTLIGPVLVYTIQQTDPKKFNAPFVTALVEYLAGKLAPGIVQDKTLSTTIMQEAQIVLQQSLDEDSNLGNNYRNDMEEPDLDPFVTGRDISPTYGPEEQDYFRKYGIYP